MTETNTGGGQSSGAPASNGAASSAGAAGAGAAAADWGATDFHAMLPQDVRADPVFANFKGAAKEVLPKFVQSYIGAQKLVGAPPEQIVRLPKDGADSAAWDQVWNRLGRPESPDKYELKGPEGLNLNPKLEQLVRGSFHKNGVPAKAAAAIFKDFTEGQKAEYDALMAERTSSAEKTATEFKAKWGEKYDENLRMSSDTYDKLFPEKLRAKLEASGLDSDPDMIAVMHKLANTISFKEDKMLPGTSSAGGANRDIATVKNERITVHKEVMAMKNPLDPVFKEKNARLQSLLEEEAKLATANQA